MKLELEMEGLDHKAKLIDALSDLPGLHGNASASTATQGMLSDLLKHQKELLVTRSQHFPELHPMSKNTYIVFFRNFRDGNEKP